MKNEPFRPAGQRGFSLLEILVTLTILGFLVAMTAPRLAGVTAGGLKTTTQMNMADLLDFLTVDLQKDGKYPKGMINIVSVDGGAGTYYKPMVSDQNPDNDPEVLGHHMDRRHGLRIHYLNAAEADELRALGVLHVYNYNSPYDRDVAVLAGSPQMQPVTTGIAVLMTGGGDADGDGVIDATEVALDEADRGRPEQLFRMVFGFGMETSLVKDGLVFNAPTCPESGMLPINYVWQYYGLLLPRLAATSQRLQGDDPLGSGGMLTAYGVTGSRASGELTATLNRTVDAYEKQDRAFFAVMNAEGDVHPGNDMTGWGLDFDNDGDID